MARRAYKQNVLAILIGMTLPTMCGLLLEF